MSQTSPVQPARVAGLTGLVEATPTMDTSAYASGDVFGSLMTLTGAVRDDGYTAILQSIVLRSITAIGAAEVDVVIFDEAPGASYGADNAAFAIADADIAKIIGCVSLDALFSVDSVSCVLQATNIGLPVKAIAGQATLYAQMVARASLTTTAAAISLRFGFLQD